VIRIRSSALAALAGVVALGGCGGGDDNKPSNTVERVYRAPTTGQTTPEDAPVTPPAPAPTTTETTPVPTEPQQSPGEGDGTNGGGGGGTEPARTELTFTGTSSGVTPRNASVAPYISVKVSLVSKDGSSHTLAIDGQTAKVGGTRKSAFFTLPGIRPGKSYSGTADGKPVRILASSEPGP
jgi:hypothetical protein